MRIKIAAELINRYQAVTVLDIGCRDTSLKQYLNGFVKYSGNDIVQNTAGNVDYVGDFLTYDFQRHKFDVTVALDVLEHTDDPYRVLHKMKQLTNQKMIINLPNIYNLKNRFAFFFRGKLGDKYKFRPQNSLDRHRWVMGRQEIIDFYRFQAEQYNLQLEILDLCYGYSRTGPIGKLKYFFSSLLPKDLMTVSVIGIFSLENDSDINV